MFRVYLCLCSSNTTYVSYVSVHAWCTVCTYVWCAWCTYALQSLPWMLHRYAPLPELPPLNAAQIRSSLLSLSSLHCSSGSSFAVNPLTLQTSDHFLSLITCSTVTLSHLLLCILPNPHNDHGTRQVVLLRLRKITSVIGLRRFEN